MNYYLKMPSPNSVINKLGGVHSSEDVVDHICGCRLQRHQPLQDDPMMVMIEIEQFAAIWLIKEV